MTEDLVRTKLLGNKGGAPPALSVMKKDNKNRLISQIITGVQNEIRNESGLIGGVKRSLLMGAGHKCMLQIEALILQTETRHMIRL